MPKIIVSTHNGVPIITGFTGFIPGQKVEVEFRDYPVPGGFQTTAYALTRNGDDHFIVPLSR